MFWYNIRDTGREDEVGQRLKAIVLQHIFVLNSLLQLN